MSVRTLVATATGRAVYYGREWQAKLDRLGAGYAAIDSRPPSELHVWDGGAWVESPALLAAAEADRVGDLRDRAIAAIAKRQARITLAHNEAIRAIYLAMPVTIRPELPAWIADTVQALHDIVIAPELRPGDEL